MLYSWIDHWREVRITHINGLNGRGYWAIYTRYRAAKMVTLCFPLLSHTAPEAKKLFISALYLLHLNEHEQKHQFHYYWYLSHYCNQCYSEYDIRIVWKHKLKCYCKNVKLQPWCSNPLVDSNKLSHVTQLIKLTFRIASYSNSVHKEYF